MVKVEDPAYIACQFYPQFLQPFSVFERFGMRFTKPIAKVLEQIDFSVHFRPHLLGEAADKIVRRGQYLHFKFHAHNIPILR
jgi:hypothetical protein